MKREGIIRKGLKTAAAAMFALAMVLSIPSFVFGEEQDSEQAERTILLYCCGADLESTAGMATHNLKQILASNFSSDTDINVIIMTGGSNSWQLDDNNDPEDENGYLANPDNVIIPEDAGPDGRISGVYNQIWEARGADSLENPGQLVLKDGDGISGTTVKSEEELMTDPATLKAFIDYGVANYPAKKYDLILWDHGGGPCGGFGHDEHFDQKKAPEGVMNNMPLAGIVDALSDNAVTKADADGDGEKDKFDFVNFDACLMGNVELSLILSDYTKYYIASADTEPGYGQYYGPYVEGKYSGWLDDLGDPNLDSIYNSEDGTFELGKVIVDDYFTFYMDENSPGSGSFGTLAVFDTEKLVDNDAFFNALTDLTAQLKEEAETESGGVLQIYDELKSARKTINYSFSQLLDLADLAALLGVADAERDGSTPDDRTNAYSDLADTFNRLFSHPDGQDQSYGPGAQFVTENDFMYAKCTSNEKTKGIDYYKDGAVNYGFLTSTGMTVFFPDYLISGAAVDYFDAMNPVLEMMPESDKRRVFLEQYKEVVADYATILYTGKSVAAILNEEKAFNPKSNPAYGDRTKVDYDMVMSYWKDSYLSSWDYIVSHFLNEAGVRDYQPWLTNMIAQMAGDALVKKDLDVTKEEQDDGFSYTLIVNEGNENILESVGLNVDAELPVLTAYINSLTGKDKRIMSRRNDFSIGTIEGFKNQSNEWIIPEFEQKWYAVNDGTGNGGDGPYHVASIYHADEEIVAVPALYGSSEDGNDADRMVFLEFSNEADKDSQELKSLYFVKENGSSMEIDPKSLTSDVRVLPILYVNSSAIKRKYFAPISKEDFVINSGNADSITLDYVSVENIPDIEDTSGDGEPLKSTLTTTDLYGHNMDISQCIDKTLKHISLAEIEPGVYTGEELVPKVTCEGNVLEEGVDYTWEKVDDVIGEGEDETFVTPQFIKPGEYVENVLLTGKGQYTGYAFKTFTINKASIDGASAVLAETSYTYDGKAHQPAVQTVEGWTLTEADYTIEIRDSKGNTVSSPTDAGIYTMYIIGKGDFNGTASATYEISKAANKLKVKGKKVTVKYSKVKKKKKTLGVSKVIKFSNKGQGTKTYTKVSGNKKITIAKKTGKITIKKGLKKGTYKIKVKVKAAGNTNYKASAAKKVTIKIRVKK